MSKRHPHIISKCGFKRFGLSPLDIEVTVTQRQPDKPHHARLFFRCSFALCRFDSINPEPSLTVGLPLVEILVDLGYDRANMKRAADFREGDGVDKYFAMIWYRVDQVSPDIPSRNPQHIARFFERFS